MKLEARALRTRQASFHCASWLLSPGCCLLPPTLPLPLVCCLLSSALLPCFLASPSLPPSLSVLLPRCSFARARHVLILPACKSFFLHMFCSLSFPATALSLPLSLPLSTFSLSLPLSPFFLLLLLLPLQLPLSFVSSCPLPSSVFASLRSAPAVPALPCDLPALVNHPTAAPAPSASTPSPATAFSPPSSVPALLLPPLCCFFYRSCPSTFCSSSSFTFHRLYPRSHYLLLLLALPPPHCWQSQVTRRLALSSAQTENKNKNRNETRKRQIDRLPHQVEHSPPQPQSQEVRQAHWTSSRTVLRVLTVLTAKGLHGHNGIIVAAPAACCQCPAGSCGEFACCLLLRLLLVAGLSLWLPAPAVYPFFCDTAHPTPSLCPALPPFGFGLLMLRRTKKGARNPLPREKDVKLHEPSALAIDLPIEGGALQTREGERG